MFSLLPSKIFFTTTCALAALNSVSARSLDSLSSRTNSGINCDGNALCIGHSGGLNNIFEAVDDTVALPINQTLDAGSVVASYAFSNTFGHGICATIDTKYTIGPSTTGLLNSLADVVQDLINHGCDPCGTAPTVRTGNDLSKGALTVNYCAHPPITN